MLVLHGAEKWQNLEMVGYHRGILEFIPDLEAFEVLRRSEDRETAEIGSPRITGDMRQRIEEFPYLFRIQPARSQYRLGGLGGTLNAHVVLARRILCGLNWQRDGETRSFRYRDLF